MILISIEQFRLNPIQETVYSFALSCRLLLPSSSNTNDDLLIHQYTEKKRNEAIRLSSKK